MADGLGVAVIGAGMAGRAHAAAYRAASALYDPVLPPVRLVSIGDVNAEFGSLAARRFGYERNDTSWQAIAAADDIDVVSVVIANSLHREVVEGLLAAGQARAVREAAERHLGRFSGDGLRRADRIEHRQGRIHLPPYAGNRLHP